MRGQRHLVRPDHVFTGALAYLGHVVAVGAKHLALPAERTGVDGLVHYMVAHYYAEVVVDLARQYARELFVVLQVRAALEARGVKFVETDNKGRVLHGAHAGETWSSSYGKRNKKAVRSKKQERVDNTGLIPARAQQLGTKLGVKVRLIQSRSELPSSWSEKQKRRRKGWYNKATGEVVIVVPNNNSIADVEATVLHEIVGHKGLRELFGKDFDAFLGNVFNNVDEETRRKIVDRAMRNGWDFKKATEEYLASLAESTDFENEVNRSAWQKIKDFFMELLRKAGIMLSRPLTDADLRYILWRSYQRRVE